MSKTAIIFWSGTGNTESMAKAILEGAKTKNADIDYFSVSEITAGDAASYDTLAPLWAQKFWRNRNLNRFLQSLNQIFQAKA